jgi:nucleotide-binding universal stress UspA family protein
MSDLLLQRNPQQAQLGRLLIVLNHSVADERALETALQLAACTHASLHALLLESEFRGYSLVIGELERLRSTRHERFAAHAFRLCDRALEQGLKLPLELVNGDGQGWLRDWINASRFDLVVVTHEHRAVFGYLPTSLSARVRRSAACPVLVVK